MCNTIQEYLQDHGMRLESLQYETLSKALNAKYGCDYKEIEPYSGHAVVCDPEYTFPYVKDELIGRAVIYKKQNNAHELVQIVTGNALENEVKLGIATDISSDGVVLAIMSESITIVRHKKRSLIESPIRIYTRTTTQQYIYRQTVFPKFIEKGSEYGHLLMLSADGRFLFVSAPGKENDASTAAPGATGAVYTFVYDDKSKVYKQHQLVRPVNSDSRRFGQLVYLDDNEDLWIEDDSGKKGYRYSFEKLGDRAEAFDSGWVFKED
jgi:hypothetical protein